MYNHPKLTAASGDTVNAILAAINKNHNNAITIGLHGEIEVIPTISTGSIALDKALGVGGFPIGRHVEIYGPESSGKTSLTLHAIVECQKLGGTAAFIDAEHALDLKYATNIGVDIEELMICQPDHAEQALDIIETLARSGIVNLIVVDSVAALVPKAELEGEMGDASVGAQARLMSKALRKLTGVCQNNGVTILWINQIRSKIGVMFGNPETVSGGNALKFYASQRLDIRRIGQVKTGEEISGNRTKVKVVKNKVAPPYKEVEFDIVYGQGIDMYGEVVDLAVENKIIQKSGSWFSYGDTRLGQGRPNLINLVKSSPEMFTELKTKVLSLDNLQEVDDGQEAEESISTTP